MKKLISLLFLVFLLSTIATASSGNLDIDLPEQKYYPIDENITLYFSVLGQDAINSSDIGCNLTLYDYSSDIYKESSSYDGQQYYVTIPANNSPESRGDYNYDVVCSNSNNSLYGVVGKDISFTNSPQTREFTNNMALPLIIGIGFVSSFFFYFAYRQEDRHQIVKNLSIFFGMLGILLIPVSITGNAITNSQLFMNLVFTYFVIFMFYFVLTLVYTLVTEKFPGVKGRIRRLE